MRHGQSVVYRTIVRASRLLEVAVPEGETKQGVTSLPAVPERGVTQDPPTSVNPTRDGQVDSFSRRPSLSSQDKSRPTTPALLLGTPRFRRRRTWARASRADRLSSVSFPNRFCGQTPPARGCSACERTRSTTGIWWGAVQSALQSRCRSRARGRRRAGRRLAPQRPASSGHRGRT